MQKKLYIFINLKYKIFVLFYINNIQVIFYKSNKVLIKKIIKQIKVIYNLYIIKDIK
jgi:hypothetical protein